MANHASAKKRIRQTLKRTERNRHVRSTVRTYIKKVREEIEGGNAEAAKSALADATRRIDMAVSKGVYPKKRGSRYISRLSRQVSSL